VPDLRARPNRAEHVVAILRSFGTLAVTSVTALAATGLLLTAEQVTTVDGLLTTPYGLILLAKVALVIVAGLLGLRLTIRLRRGNAFHRTAGALSDTTGALRGTTGAFRGVTGEATALVMVLLLAGALAAAGPAKGPRFPVGGPVASTPEVTGQAADLIDTVTIRPNRPGRNVVTIVVSDTRRPAPAPFTGVTVSLSGPDGTRKVHPVTRAAEGWTLTVDDIRTAGDWKLAVTVMRDGLSPVTSVHAWAVPRAGRSAPVVVSAAPLQPWLSTVAGVGTGAVAIWAVALTIRRRRRAPSTTPTTAVDLMARPASQNVVADAERLAVPSPP
jgi:copper transport protein